MIVKTLFCHEGRFRPGEVEIKMMPGVPMLHIVGQPDARIRECGLKLKSAIRSCGMKWPQGNQIVVNLRPAHFRKTSSGVDLAIALGFLALTGQMEDETRALISSSVIYGEVALTGRIFAPADLESALRACPSGLITGICENPPREGEWSQLTSLADLTLQSRRAIFPWETYWRRPNLPRLMLSSGAYESLWLSAHMRLNVLVTGPQGSGKSTFARALYGLSSKPEREKMSELCSLFGEEAQALTWRPCEAPHHSTPPLAMIGGGYPLRPGVISRAHGGVLIMDEFLEFAPSVLEALREPLERGYIDHARRGERIRFPADFQLVGTANLCPCGKLRPPGVEGCRRSLTQCRSICSRLSGPVMDRFDLLVFSHDWLRTGGAYTQAEARLKVEELGEFARRRGDICQAVPGWISELGLSHRRCNSVLRVARALADAAGSVRIENSHFQAAYAKVVEPMQILGQLFA